MQWIDIDGSVIVGAQGMANNAHIPVEDIALVLQGKSLADMSRLVFRDPNHFRAGELHRHTPQWLSLLDDLNDDRFSEVRDWITNDDRFLNLWIEDRPFSLNSVQHLPKYVQKGFYQTVCDDKSGYDHIKLHPSSRTYFGFQ